VPTVRINPQLACGNPRRLGPDLENAAEFHHRTFGMRVEARQIDGCPVTLFAVRLARGFGMMDFLASLEASGFGTWLRESGSIWAYPAVLTLHTMGLGVLVGASSVLALRVLGCAPGIPLEPLERLFPIMWTGFWINAITGVALFVADATTKGTTTVFMAKLAFVAAAIWVLQRTRRVVFSQRPASGSTSARLLAATLLVLWVAAIVTGRYMAYV
jgi:hypothetical protein